ncbi:hypothetical protein F2Q69_00012093 [Brassica cretica]|uniref:Uncharacterized protein n=1 Tax=Brassica cretica TaxID=69181 RepID=A0A8S9QS57_BRACR|nr:hypothetical protein F2Q69_00012093 [Brassica cretica]
MFPPTRTVYSGAYQQPETPLRGFDSGGPSAFSGIMARGLSGRWWLRSAFGVKGVIRLGKGPLVGLSSLGGLLLSHGHVIGLKGGRLCRFSGASSAYSPLNLLFAVHAPCGCAMFLFHVFADASDSSSSTSFSSLGSGHEVRRMRPFLLGAAFCAGGCYEALGEMFSVGPLSLREDHWGGQNYRGSTLD